MDSQRLATPLPSPSTRCGYHVHSSPWRWPLPGADRRPRMARTADPTSCVPVKVGLFHLEGGGGARPSANPSPAKFTMLGRRQRPVPAVPHSPSELNPVAFSALGRRACPVATHSPSGSSPVKFTLVRKVPSGVHASVVGCVSTRLGGASGPPRLTLARRLRFGGLRYRPNPEIECPRAWRSRSGMYFHFLLSNGSSEIFLAASWGRKQTRSRPSL
mmetsp:Transcript_8350/g.14923  ORF Transcript_8350/g.14923 Transcript_8350/m.14923 type:complete len:216 (-) Transcript_8350:436-1083(-)